MTDRDEDAELDSPKAVQSIEMTQRELLVDSEAICFDDEIGKVGLVPAKFSEKGTRNAKIMSENQSAKG